MVRPIQLPIKIWFVSDSHHGHTNVIDYCGRPFVSVTDQDQKLVEAWNSRVRPGDMVFVLGDFSFYAPPKTTEILKSLNGQKTLIKGNHDHSKDLALTQGWSRVLTYHEMKIGVDRVIMSHFPFMSWHNQQRGAYHLHGHCHGKMNYPGELGATRIMDVGVDHLVKIIGDYRPIEWEEIKDLLSMRKYGHSDDGHRVRRD